MPADAVSCGCHRAAGWPKHANGEFFSELGQPVAVRGNLIVSHGIRRKRILLPQAESKASEPVRKKKGRAGEGDIALPATET